MARFGRRRNLGPRVFAWKQGLAVGPSNRSGWPVEPKEVEARRLLSGVTRRGFISTVISLVAINSQACQGRTAWLREGTSMALRRTKGDRAIARTKWWALPLAAMFASGLALVPFAATGAAAAEPPLGDSPADAPQTSPGAPMSPSAGAGAPSSAAPSDSEGGPTFAYYDRNNVRSYFVSNGYDLDQYLFGTDSPLDFTMYIDGVYPSRTTANGFPTTSHPLFSKNALITLAVYDVDDEDGEVDGFYVNGFALPGTLAGMHGKWSIVTFEIPATYLKFSGGPEGSGKNDFEVRIDTEGIGWAVEVAWANLKLDPGPLPIAMVHGLNGNGDSDGNGFANTWGAARDVYEDLVPDLDDRIIAPVLTGQDGTSIEAPMLADELFDLQFETGMPQVNLLAHSFGGLTSRCFIFDLNNSGYFGRVRDLVMIATPNGGSELATDMCNSQKTHWLLANLRDAFNVVTAELANAGDCTDEDSKLYQLQQWYVRDVFNEIVRDSSSEYPDRTSTEYYTIAGTKASAGSGILNGEDDGNVEVHSVFWLRPEDGGRYDIQPSNGDHPGLHEPLAMHNLRHSDIIKEDSDALTDAACFQYGFWPKVLCDLSEDSGGASPMEASATEDESPADLQHVDTDVVTIPAGETRTVSVPTAGVPSASLLVLSDGADGDLSATFGGEAFEDVEILESTMLGVDVVSPTSGSVAITNTSASAVSAVVLTETETNQQVSVSATPQHPAPGDTVTVTVRTSGATAPTSVSAFVVNKAVTTKSAVTLTNQGGGVYAGTFTAPLGGTYTIDAVAQGSFGAVSATSALQVQTQAATLAGIATEATTDEDGDGLWDSLDLGAEVDVDTAGDFRVVADVVDRNGNLVTSVGWNGALTSGVTTVPLRIEGREIFKRRADGPYRVTNVAVAHDDALMTLAFSVDDLGSTDGYDFEEFEHERLQIDPASLTESTPVDTDGDGLYDFIEVRGSLTTDLPGEYSVSGRLRDPDGDSTGEAHQVVTLVNGVNQFTLRFPTTDIANGAYGSTVFSVGDVAVLNNTNLDVQDFVIDALETRSYSSRNMDGYPVGPPREARWAQTVPAGGLVDLTVEGVNPADLILNSGAMSRSTDLTAQWDSPVSVAFPDVGYRVQLSEDADFADVLVERDLPTSATSTDFHASDGVAFGHSYYFRVALLVDGEVAAGWANSERVDVSEEDSGPVVLHAPVPTGYHGQDIPIRLFSSCGSGHECNGTLNYRTTPNPESLIEPAGTAGTGSWTTAPLSEVSRVSADADYDVVEWAATIPGWMVTTHGVDYFLEATDQFARTRVPGGTYTSTPGLQPPNVGYWHVHTVSPPLLAHVPPPFGSSGEDLRVELQAACSTGNCDATLFYRTTNDDATATESDIVAENGELIATPNWPTATMQQVGAPASLGDAGEMLTFEAEIPASFVDTRGVDYFFHVTDGETQAWSPGTTYEGYFAPLDGMRTGYFHTHVLEQPHIVHAPVATAPFRSDIAVSAQSNCPVMRACTARLYYRTTTNDVLDTTTPFASRPMAVVGGAPVGSTRPITVTGAIPASVVDTRGVDYFFSISDGATTTWWPGTSHVDGYVPVPGTRVGYHHIRVLEPPHIVHQPPGAVPALTDLAIEATVTCVTASCGVTLHYQKALGTTEPFPHAIPMTRVGTLTPSPAGPIATYRATIPAADVTTAQLSYYIKADDGYTRSYAPGTFYWGAYMPVDGQRIAAYPVRVLEPPHVVHVPPGAAAIGSPVTLAATSNCATPSCIGTLHWRLPGGAWQSLTMSATRSPSDAPTGDLMSYSATIPQSLSSAGFEHWIEVFDGYVAERTPTLSTLAY
ncbi:MAG: hypothetical protein ACT4PW_02050 [Acidimicrobiia bacterium]